MRGKQLFNGALSVVSSVALVAALTPSAAFAASGETPLVAEFAAKTSIWAAIGGTPAMLFPNAIVSVFADGENAGSVTAMEDADDASENGLPVDENPEGSIENDESDASSGAEDGEDSGSSASSDATDSENKDASGASEGEQSGSGLDDQAVEEGDEDSEDPSSDLDEESDEVSAQATTDDSEEKSDASSKDVESTSDADEHTISFDSVKNGTATVVSVQLPKSEGGSTYTLEQLEANSTSDSAYFANNVLCAPTDSEVTVKLMPDRGYQLTSTNLNSGDIRVTALSSDENIGEYRFTMPAEALTLDCGFEAIDDVVESTNADVDGDDSSIKNADEAVSSGTLRLTIEEIESDDAKQNLIDNAKQCGSKEADVVACIDMSLDNIVYQGSENDVWSTDLETLSNAITISLKLSDAITKDAKEFYLIREHDGKYQHGPVEFDSATNTISFSTTAFSDYAIVKGAPSANDNSSNSSDSNSKSSASSSTSSSNSKSTTPKAGDTNSGAPLLAFAGLSALALVVAVRRLRVE